MEQTIAEDGARSTRFQRRLSNRYYKKLASLKAFSSIETRRSVLCNSTLSSPCRVHRRSGEKCTTRFASTSDEETAEPASEARRTQRCVGGSAALQRADYDTAAYVGIACVQLIPCKRAAGKQKKEEKAEEEEAKIARSLFYFYFLRLARAKRY